MAKDHLIKLGISLIILGGGIFCFTHFASAEWDKAVDVYCDGVRLPPDGSVRIFDETNWTPGSIITKFITFLHTNKPPDETYSINLVTDTTSGYLAKKLSISITCDSFTYGVTEPKTLEQFYADSPDTNPLYLFNIGPGEEKSCDFKVEFKPGPDDNDYNYNDKSPHYGEVCDTKFNIIFGFDPVVTITGAGGPTAFPGPRGDGTLDLPTPAEFIKEKVIAPAIVPAITAVKTMAKEVAPLKLPLTLPRVGAWSVLILASTGLIWEIISFRNFKRRK